MRRLAPLIVLLILGGCGGSDGEQEGQKQGGGTKVVSLGDSITAGAPLWDPDKATRDSLGAGVADEKSQYEYWAERRLGDASFKNCGVSGQRTDEIATRLDQCVSGAEVLIVQGGANDINQGRSVDRAAKDLRGMVRRGKQRDLRVAITQVIPWPGGHPAATPKIARLNTLIDQIGKEEDVPVYEWNAALADPAKPGLMRPEYVSDDQIHPTVAGYKRLGEEVELP